MPINYKYTKPCYQNTTMLIASTKLLSFSNQLTKQVTASMKIFCISVVVPGHMHKRQAKLLFKAN